MPEIARDTMLSFVQMMASAMDAGSPFTHGRSYRCSKYALCMGKELGFESEALRDLEYAGLLQDIGKKAVLYGILQKPGPMDDHERARMATHTQISSSVLAEISFLQGASAVIKSLNERWDGTGNPEGTAQQHIPMGSRVLAVVSAFDAMTSDRPYRAGLSAEEAYDELRLDSGGRFDPEVVELLISLHQRGELFREFEPESVEQYLSSDCQPPGLDAYLRQSAA